MNPSDLRTSLYDSMGDFTESAIRAWVRLTGRSVLKAEAPWLRCPMGPAGRIGVSLYSLVEEQEGLQILSSADSGLVDDFDSLKSSDFDPESIDPEIRRFYEHTSRYSFEAWSEAGALSRIFLWFLVSFVSRRMDQLNFPVSSLEMAEGMTSEVIVLVDPRTGRRVYTGWLRRFALSGRVIYAGLYSIEVPGGYPYPCVKVSFPLPLGSSTVFLRPEAQPDASLKLNSSGSRFGDPGFYRMVDVDSSLWKVRYLRTLRELFHVFIDRQGTLRAEHTVHFVGLRVLRLRYKIDRIVRDVQAIVEPSLEDGDLGHRGPPRDLD